jgi:hypothetical protein
MAFLLIFSGFSRIIKLPQRHAPQEACPPRRGAGATFLSIACSFFISLHYLSANSQDFFKIPNSKTRLTRIIYLKLLGKKRQDLSCFIFGGRNI